MRKLVTTIAGSLLLAAALLVSVATPAHAACTAEPFGGDVYVYAASHRSITVATPTQWVVHPGNSSDATIPPGYCEDVDSWYLPSGYDAFRLDGRLGWVRMETSTGWHSLTGSNCCDISRALFKCSESPLC